MKHPSPDTLKNFVQSQLREVINVHGPVTMPLIGSVSKRIVGQYVGYLRSANSKCYTEQHRKDIQTLNGHLRENAEVWGAWKRLRKEIQP